MRDNSELYASQRSLQAFLWKEANAGRAAADTGVAKRAPAELARDAVNTL
jgi:hypothetical protein